MAKSLSYVKYAFKSIRAKKFRFLLGVLALAIAIGMFGVTNVIINAISLSYLPRIAEESGQVDISIERYNITDIPPIQDYESLISIVDNVSGISGATPRYELHGARFQGANKNFTVAFLGIDPSREKSIGFGEISLTPNIDLANLPLNHCWVRQEIVEALELEIGEAYSVEIGFSIVNITLDASFENIDMLPANKENMIIVNIQTLAPFIGGIGIATEVVAQFANRDDIYDINRPEQTIEKAKELGIAVQEAIGVNFQVYLPIATALENRGTGLVFLRILFNTLAVLSLLVSGFLIFSLMTVSVEEKTREFALYRTIGAKKRQIFLLVLFEASITCVSGSIIGIGFSYLIALFVKQFLLRRTLEVDFTLSPLIILYSVFLGIAVAILASLFPALRAVRKSIISGLNPLKADEPNLKLVRERGPNKLLFIVGFGIAAATGLIFILIPIMTITSSDTLFFGILIALFFGFGFGVSLIVVGVIEPLVENLFLYTIRPIFKKTNKIVRMFLKRNRRRNAITAMMFILSFGTTMIISTTFQVQDMGSIKNISNYTGSDISLYDLSYDTNGTQLMEDILDEFDEIISASYSTLPIDSVLTGMWTVAGDQIFFKSFGVDVIGVPSNALVPLHQDQITLTDGSFEMFDDVQTNDTTIISEALSKELSLGVGDTLRLKLLTLNPILIGLNYTRDVFLEIVGIASKLPGYTGIHEQERFASGSTIFIGENTWVNLTKMDFQNSAFRIFFDVGNEESILTIGEEIRRKYQTDNIGVVIEQEIINRLNEDNQIRAVLINIMLIFTIIIALFGVFASTYSNVAESTKTIGILKAIGLKNRDVDGIFILESSILTMSSCLLGGIVGYILGYYLFMIDAISQEWTIPIVAPSLISILSLIIAIVIAGLGAFIATRVISKKSASELIRVE